MFRFRKKNEETKDINTIAQEQLERKREVFESLKAYDEGKKEISTSNVETHLRDLQPTP